MAEATHLATVSILLSDEDTPEQLRRAMRSGARECLFWPFQQAGLLQAVRDVYAEQQKRATSSFADAANPTRTARVMAVGGAKGGIGKTTITTNLAVALAQETGEPTVLLDLYTQFGDAAMMLNVEARRTLMNLFEMGETAVDPQLLEDCMETHETGIRVLVASKSPVALDALSAPFLDIVLNLLKQQYRYVVIDVPPYLHPGTLHAFSHATTVLLVANCREITALNDTRYLIDALTGKYVDRQNIQIVLNRLASTDLIRVGEVERVLDCQVAAHLPNDDNLVPRSINYGIPVVASNPNSPVAQALRGLARRVALPEGMETAALARPAAAPIRAPRRGKLFEGIFGRAKATGEAA